MSYVMPLGGKVFVKEIRWEDYAAGSVLLIDDGTTGHNLVNETPGAGDVDLGVMRFGPFGWVNGFRVVTLSAGNITVTITKS